MDSQQTPPKPPTSSDDESDINAAPPASAPGTSFSPDAAEPTSTPATDEPSSEMDSSETSSSDDASSESGVAEDKTTENDAPAAEASPEIFAMPDATPAADMSAPDTSQDSAEESATPEPDADVSPDVSATPENESALSTDMPDTAPTETPTEPAEPTGSTEPIEPTVPPTPPAELATPESLADAAFQPDVRPAIASVAGAAVVATKPSKKKLKLALLIAAAIVVLGGGAAAAYVGYIVPNQPKYVLARAIGNTASTDKLKTAHLDGDFTFKQGGTSYSGSLTGSAGGTGFDLSTSVDLSITKATIELLTTDGKSAYLKISGLDGLPEMLQSMGGTEATTYAPIIKAVNGQWVEIDQSLLNNFGQGQQLATANTRLSNADAQQLENAYRDHLFMDVTKVYSDQKINGVNSYHYQARINKAELQAFLAQVKAANIKSIDITSDNLSTIANSSVDKYPIDVWISKGDKFIDQISYTTSGSNGSMSLRLALGDINKPVTITKPATSKTLLQVLGSSNLFSGLSSSSTMNMTNMTGNNNASMNYTATVE